MRQIFQSLRDGETQLVELPCPQPRRGCLRIQTRRTLISSGTERMLQEFGKASWLGKARQQPDKFRQVLDKIRTDGLAAAFEAVRDKLEEPLPLGYCNVGVVLDVGPGVSGFAPGDRVLSNGPHAEIVCVPQNLAARIPPSVTDDEAVFGVLGAVALQGIRLAAPTLGECFLVTGLGLVGLLAVQLLRAHGARVIGADFQPERLRLAQAFGAETVQLPHNDLPARCAEFSRGRGLDGVLITASTQSHEPLHQAAAVCRKRGRIVLTGVAGLHLSRDDFYKKELSFQVSCSYGPGRYDANYEEQGCDYPAAYVRWTAQRNFEAVLDMLAAGQLQVEPLISHRFPLEQATRAYELISSPQPSLGILLDYTDDLSDNVLAATIPLRPDVRLPAAHTTDTDSPPDGNRLTVSAPVGEAQGSARAPRVARKSRAPAPVVGVIGTGQFAVRHLMPAFRAAGVHFRGATSRGGATAATAARRFGCDYATSDVDLLLHDPEIEAVIIATRHDSHADLVCRALLAGKHVFVEKPLALSREQILDIQQTLARVRRFGGTPLLMVGFNRRFAPQVVQVRELLQTVAEPKAFVLTVNAGMVAAEHWTRDSRQGGGRFVGEGCHFVDLLRYLAGQSITHIQACGLRARAGQDSIDDQLTCTLRFADGSVGTIHYLANGHRSFPKERLEVFAAGRVLQLDNFRRLTGYGWPRFRRLHLWRQDKGHRAEAAAFVAALRTGLPPIPWDELVEVSCVTLDIAAAAAEGGMRHYTPAAEGASTYLREPPALPSVGDSLARSA
jgi:predicted dehydrogenase/threonine dehydrogenase-like Zn-dependent dehydrogenase